ncbi:diaminobutyrate--2-oxoglutarate transaminase [Aureisphaera galaxeae]|uniref:diaminobutyrate--2-oxoglutarate transaminase n=1 Tax=Aureisphaera galaxeae TaxID=1538023 RepID=UPI002350B6A1|nr:diaminobutyrate--2-oxoglutarate transaminase [Aureisphaera galaxeae]MDC8004731.1 diaminobutyrate--2-oxoglutarate transaminase [Aureisphaera galaxeae]
MNLTPETNIESNVSGYSKSFPTTFRKAKNDILVDNNEKEYLDFFSGAGALNYGHNNDYLKKEIVAFLGSDAPIHCLDMDSEMKLNFLNAFQDTVLKPRGLDYKLQFPSPSGTNAVEAAIKLARKVTKRSKILSFTNSFHGMTASSLALSGSQEHRHNDIPAQDVLFFPFDGYFGEDVDTLEYIKQMVASQGSGNTLPAAIILETIQAEGGIKVASVDWLVGLQQFANENGILLIVDDIQVGCGRTGNFFSFERAGIYPDIVLLSKSISGFGLPLSLVLMKPELDIWTPGEHNGTFRANNLALCGATTALDYWKDRNFQNEIEKKAQVVEEKLNQLRTDSEAVKAVRGMGLIWGIEFESGEFAKKVSQQLFEKGLIIETCGNKGQVVKLLPPLTITERNLSNGLDLIQETIHQLHGQPILTY